MLHSVASRATGGWGGEPGRTAEEPPWTPINRTFAPVQALVDELARCGMRHAVTSPGSRNAPLALALAAEPRIDSVSVIDERAAGFMALGMAKASGRPVAVTCTSGSAAANLLPAVVEASQARVPLVVLTADRPPELREVGAGQAIDQLKLYGSAAKWFVEVGNHEPGRATATHHRALGCRAYWTAAGGRPGPVHLNFPLREPLDPSPEALLAADWAGREDGRPWVERREPEAALGEGQLRELAGRMASVARGTIVCGTTTDAVAEPVVRLAAATGWPVLAEPASGLRCGGHDRSHVVAHYDVLLRDEDFAATHSPDLVLRIGDTPTSKSLRAWLAQAPQVVLDPHAAWHEPSRTAELLLHASPATACEALSAALEGHASAPTSSSGPPGGATPPGGARSPARAAGEPAAPGHARAESKPEPPYDGPWLSSWRAADALVPAALAAAPEPSEPGTYTAAAGALPEGAIVWMASSMPVRDVESFWPAGPEQVRFLANRGANGIDGTVSSAAGAARATGAPTLVLCGELALLHDLGGLLAARRAGIELTIVYLDNGGGGIFDFLPVATSAQRRDYEQHVATPSGLDLAAVAALAGIEHRRAASAAEVRSAIGAGPALIEVRGDRAENVRVHRQIVQRIAGALAGQRYTK